MRLFLSVDMEGTTGLERLEEIFRGLPGYDTFRQLMAGDANAVIRGAIEGGATEIVVSDSHGYMCNIYPNDLTPGVLLKRGLLNRQWCQMKTFDASFEAVIMIGYHGCDSGAYLDHRVSGRKSEWTVRARTCTQRISCGRLWRTRRDVGR